MNKIRRSLAVQAVSKSDLLAANARAALTVSFRMQQVVIDGIHQFSHIMYQPHSPCQLKLAIVIMGIGDF